MNKEKLLEQINDAEERVQRAVLGDNEIGNLTTALGQLIDVLKVVVPALADAAEIIDIEVMGERNMRQYPNNPSPTSEFWP